MKNLLLFTAAFACFFIANGQTPLTSNDLLSTIGSDFRQYLVATQEPGEAGINVTWNYGDILPTANVPIEISETGSDNPEALYPGANYIWSINFDETFVYFAITPNSYDYYGDFSGDDFQLFYTNPISYLQFPTTYEQAYVDSFYANYNTGVSTGIISGAYDVLVDGHGTLVLPWGTLENVYRVTAQFSQTEHFINDGDTTLAYYSGTNVSWFAAGFAGPVMVINNGVLSIPDLNVEQDLNSTNYLGDFDFLGVDEKEIVSDLQVFPNPATDIINVSFSQEVPQNVSLELLDVRGRKLRQASNLNGGTGVVNYSLDINELPAGFYLLRLSSEKGVQSRKVVVK